MSALSAHLPPVAPSCFLSVLSLSFFFLFLPCINYFVKGEKETLFFANQEWQQVGISDKYRSRINSQVYVLKYLDP